MKLNDIAKDYWTDDYNTPKFNYLHEIIKKILVVKSITIDELDVESTLEKIYVGRPYFAFDNLYKYNDVWVGKVIAEQSVGSEATVISSAEASRHMALLGSCALAEYTEEKKYYLAVVARMFCGGDIDIFLNKSNKKKEFYVFAKKILLEDRTGHVITSIADEDGNIIFDFTIIYSIMRERLFEKVFKKHYKEDHVVITDNPYLSLDSLHDVIYLNDSVLKAVLKKTDPKNCVGHFNNFPMWPVGAMAYICIKTVEEFLKKIVQDSSLKFILHSARMDVFSPPIIDEDANFLLFYCGHDHSERVFRFSWVINSLSNSEVYNTMFISFRIV